MGAIMQEKMNLCTNATVQDVMLDAYEDNRLIHWTAINAIEREAAPTTLEIGLMRNGVFYSLRSETPGAAARGVHLRGDLRASGQFVPCARFWGATLTNHLELYAAGWTED